MYMCMCVCVCVCVCVGFICIYLLPLTFLITIEYDVLSAIDLVFLRKMKIIGETESIHWDLIYPDFDLCHLF